MMSEILVCDWCGTRVLGRDGALEHEKWHMNFLLDQGGEAALDVMERPIHFRSETGEHDE